MGESLKSEAESETRAHLRHSLHDNDLRVGAVVDELGPGGGPASLALALEVVIRRDSMRRVVFK